MRASRKLLAGLSATVLTIAGSPSYAADGGAIFAARSCVACHGENGNQPTNGEIPKIGGQNRDYLVNQLTHFKNGERTAGNAVQMKGIAAILSEDDIVAIADYLSAQ